MADIGSTRRLDRSRLAVAPLSTQALAIEKIVRADPDLMGILQVIRELALPDAWLASGAVYQTVWNALTGRRPGTGIKDYDVVYFDDRDLGWDAEDATIRRVEAAVAPTGLVVEVRNQARVHLWFERRFGFPVPPLTSSADGLSRYASTTHAVAVRLVGGNRMEVLAPYGLRDVFAMHVRPNRLYPNGPTHDAKAQHFLSVWPELTVEWWDPEP